MAVRVKKSSALEMTTLGLQKAACDNKNVAQESSHSPDDAAMPLRHNQGSFPSKLPGHGVAASKKIMSCENGNARPPESQLR